MRIKLLFLLSICSITAWAQTRVKCDATTSFVIHQKENFYCHIKLVGEIHDTGDSRVIGFKNYVLQTLIAGKGAYLSKGTEDIPVLTNYMISETQYFTSQFKEKLNLMAIPVQITKDKKAVIWYFDLPESVQKQAGPGETPAIKQVSISIVAGDFIYSIGTTQFKNQSFEEIQKMLTELMTTLNYGNGQVDQSKLCSAN